MGAEGPSWSVLEGRRGAGPAARRKSGHAVPEAISVSAQTSPRLSFFLIKNPSGSVLQRHWMVYCHEAAVRRSPRKPEPRLFWDVY